MSDAARRQREPAHGTELLSRDLTPEELDAGPILTSLDQLLIEDLTHEDDFAAALAS